MGDLVTFIFKAYFEPLPWWGKILALIAFGGLLFLLSLRFVKEGERGLKLRFGQVVRKDGKPMIIEPGFTFVVPRVDQLVRRHVRQQTMELQEQQVILRDNSIWLVSAVVFFRVRDVYKALIEIDDLDSGVRNLCMGELRAVLQSLPGVEAIKDIEAVSDALLAATGQRAVDWGIELIGFRLTNCMPSAETSAIVTAGAAVEARMAALRAAGATQDPMLAAALLGVPAVTALGAGKSMPRALAPHAPAGSAAATAAATERADGKKQST